MADCDVAVLVFHGSSGGARGAGNTLQLCVLKGRTAPRPHPPVAGSLPSSATPPRHMMQHPPDQTPSLAPPPLHRRPHPVLELAHRGAAPALCARLRQAPRDVHQRGCEAPLRRSMHTWRMLYLCAALRESLSFALAGAERERCRRCARCPSLCHTGCVARRPERSTMALPHPSAAVQPPRPGPAGRRC